MENFNPKTVTIGNQVWMAENLTIIDGGEGIYLTPENGQHYYTWDAAMRVAKSIPGWHLPTTLEWNAAALACGATERPHMDNPNYNEYDDVKVLKDKLGVKLAGHYNNGGVGKVGDHAYFWTSTECSSLSAYLRCFSTGNAEGSNYYLKDCGHSVRLVKDSTDSSNHSNPDNTLVTRIKKLEDGKKYWKDAAKANADMLSACESECKDLNDRIKELENAAKYTESLERFNSILTEQNLAYRKLLETKDAEIAEIRRSSDFYMNYYREDKEVYRPSLLAEMRKLKDRIKELETQIPKNG